MLRLDSKKPILAFLMAVLTLGFAALTHEKALFGCLLIILWPLLNLHRYHGYAWALAAVFGGLIAVYLGLAWNHPIYGGRPDNYVSYFLNNIAKAMVWKNPHVFLRNMFSVFVASGMLWVVFLMLGINAIRRQENQKKRLKYCVFFAAGWVASIIPYHMGGDIQRMVDGIWLPLYILIIDQAKSRNEMFINPSRRRFWLLLLFIQLLLPPAFSYGSAIKPLNPYAHVWTKLLK